MRRLVAAAALALALVAGASPAGAFTNPRAAHPWHRVTQSLGDALAEGDKPDATTYPWEQRCLYRRLPGRIQVRCTDGYRTTL